MDEVLSINTSPYPTKLPHTHVSSQPYKQTHDQYNVQVLDIIKNDKDGCVLVESGKFKQQSNCQLLNKHSCNYTLL